MKFRFFIICIILFSIITIAQSQGKKNVKRLFFHSHGISFQKFENLNKRITGNPQIEKPKNSTGTLDFGIFTERNRLITGYGVNFGSSLSGNRNKKSSASSYEGLSVDIGYNLLKPGRISLFPFVGLGYEKYKQVFNKDISMIPFDSVLQSNNFQQSIKNLTFSNSFFIYQLGIGLFVTSKKHTRNSIGLKLGYTGSISSKEWKINQSQTLLNSPSDRLSKIMGSLLIRYDLSKNSNK